MSNFSYIIPFHADPDQVRTANLRAVLRWLSRLPEVDVVLVEQDQAPTLQSESLPTNCRSVFTEHDGPFNKSRAFNAGFLHSEGRVVAFGDADLLVNPQALLHCFGACHSQFHAVKPYDRLVDLTLEESQSILNGNDEFAVTRSTQQLNREGIGEHLCFAAGCL